MFEEGEKYEITTGIGEEEGHSVYTVIEWRFPLLKVEDGVGTEWIWNTTSPSFGSANRRPAGKPSVYPSAKRRLGPVGKPVRDDDDDLLGRPD